MNSGESQCLFCRVNPTHLVSEDELCYAAIDSFPVTEFHTLIIPKRHVANYFDLNSSEVSALHEMLVEMKRIIEAKDDSVTGFNIGVNAGKDAGQSIFHVHVHLIPRRKGDVENPRGGVRGVIPHKQKYLSTAEAKCSYLNFPTKFSALKWV
jgi:diadenosine tetraphosphate (Ap4A) HIT family hydrolase